MAGKNMNDGCGRVLLQRGRGAGSSVIEFLTHSPVSHALLLYPDGETVIESIQFKGVQKRKITSAEWNKTECYLVDGSTPEQWAACLKEAETEIGYGYDWTSLFCWALRLHRKVASYLKWFCSEYVDYLVQKHIKPILSAERVGPCECTPADIRKSSVLIRDKTRGIQE